MMNYFTLMSYILTSAPKGPAEASDRAWMRVLGEVIEVVSPVHTQILSTLTLLSNSLLSGQSLPPYLPLPEPYEMTRQLLRLPHEEEEQRRRAKSTRSSSSSSSSSSLSEEEEEEGGGGGNTAGGEEGEQEQQKKKEKKKKTTSKTFSSSSVEEEAQPDAWNLLDARNMEQEGYTEFAVIQVCSMLVVGELAGLIRTMSQLVGTVDFSFRVVDKPNKKDNTGSSSGEGGEGEEEDDDDDDDGLSTTSSYRIQRVGTYASRATGFGPGAGSSGGRRRG